MKTPAFVFPDNPAALAAVRELGREGVPVTLLASRAGPASLSRFPNVVRVPDFYSDPKSWLEAVVVLARGTGDRPVLIPTEDAALLLVEQFQTELREVVRLPYPATGVVGKILDKLDLYVTAHDMGIGVPRFAEIHSASDWKRNADDCEWLVKPSCRYHFDAERGVGTFLSLTGGAKALEGDVSAAAKTVLDAGFRCIAQERIPGPFENLVSVGLCLDRDGRVLASFSTRKHCEYPEPFGDGLVVETIEDPGILEDSAELLRKLGYWGICDVEYKRDELDGQLKLLDANPRVWLWVGLGAAAGCTPLVRLAYELALGEGRIRDWTPPAAQGRAGLTWVSPRGAAAFLLRQYRPKRHGGGLPITLTVGSLRTMLRGLRVFRDPLYARPSTWPALIAAATKKKRKGT